MATSRLVVALALACAIDASVETERVDALGSGELARCVAEAKQASPTMQQIQAHPCPLKWAGAAADLPGYAYGARALRTQQYKNLSLRSRRPRGGWWVGGLKLSK